MFHYKSIDELRAAAEKEQIALPFSENAAVLGTPLTIDGHVIPNRIAIQPM